MSPKSAAAGSRPKSRVASKTYTIAVIAGDGTGPEVIREGRNVVEAAATQGGFAVEWRPYDLGGDRYLRTKETVPESVLKELRQVDAIYLGAIGHPDVKPGILEQGILLRLRFELDQYINLRPVKLYPGVWTPLKDKGPKDIDFVVVRENTEGLYVGAGGFTKRGTPDEVAIQTSINTRRGVERCIRFAFELTRRRAKRKKLMFCGKTNVLTFAHDLWQRTFTEVAAAYRDVETDYTHVDACCMWMVKNPEWFDVIVTDNMFGDIITDLGAMIQGGMGIAAGGNLNPEGVSMFEPIGGSAPKYTGKDVINPLAAICAGGMMLEHLGQAESAAAIERAVMQVTGTKLKSLAAGKMGYSTSQVGDLVVQALGTQSA
jgi:3-isopropylmalate dehydrogenase